MKKIVLLTTVMFFYISFLNAQIRGNAFLLGEFDNSEIEVIFLPQSPSAQYGKCYTDSNGYFEANLNGGLYKILYSKGGYQETYYQTGVIVALSPNEQLEDVVLKRGNIKYVEGNVSGIWSRDTTYIIINSISINKNETLIIKEGTNIKFNKDKEFIVDGELYVEGSENDKIIFSSNLLSPSTSSWKGLKLNSNSKVSINNAIFEYCFECITSGKNELDVNASEFRYFFQCGIYQLNGKINIYNSRFYDYATNSNYSSYAVYATGFSLMANIGCNEFFNGNGYGIIIDGYGEVYNNKIENISSASHGHGIRVSTGAKPLIYNNYIKNCINGFWIGESTNLLPNPIIYNNTISHCSAGVYFFSYYSSGSLINNVIANSNIGILGERDVCSVCYNKPEKITNNLFWNNTTNTKYIDITGLGKITTVNVNQDSVDSYYNLYNIDPLINHNGDIDEFSPALSAGDIDYSEDIGFESNKICSFDIAEKPKQEKIDTLIQDGINESTFITVYPNPAKDNIHFILNENQDATVKLFDYFGKQLMSEKISSRRNSINISNLNDGIYYVRLFEESHITSYKIIIAK